MAEETKNKKDLFVRVRASRTPLEKTESEGNDEVDSISVEVNQKESAQENIIELNIHIQARKQNT